MDEAKILELAREAGMMNVSGRIWGALSSDIIAFAGLVAKSEREACADLAESLYADARADEIARAIRSRTE